MLNTLEEFHFSLDEVKGQDIALRYLKTYAKYPDKIPPLLIFHGPSGVGKYFTAERFIKTILCMEGKACGVCPSCRQFQKKTHPDLVVFPEGESIPIGEEKNPKEYSIRWLQNVRILHTPMLSSLRFILIPDATKINSEAETALLKTLEEAPYHTRFIFLVESLNELKQTITSRGVLVPFSYLPKKNIIKIAEDQNIYLHEFQGGSFEYNFMDGSVWEEYVQMVENSCFDSILLLKLESWIKEQKNKSSQWFIEFSYKRFLDIISSLMIYIYSRNQDRDWTESLLALFEFKEFLHKEIPGMDHFILSRLFAKLTQFSN